MKIYNIKEIDNFLFDSLKNAKIIRYQKKEYINIAAAFDIETSNFYRNIETFEQKTIDEVIYLSNVSREKYEKIAIMYVWQFAINDFILIGRTWREFLEFIEKLTEFLNLSKNRIFTIYIHNLSFEFQFFRKYFDYEKIFAIDMYKPLYALTKNGLLFKCSFLLSGYDLNTLSKKLKNPIQKLIGNLDYNKIRHTETPLTEKEIKYCCNDVLIITEYINELLTTYKKVALIPLTKTGFVREYCRNNTLFFFNKETNKKLKSYSYRGLIKNLTFTDLNEFNLINRAFSGGFSHSNQKYINEICENVVSYDFTSSYPAVMVCEKFPMSIGKKIAVSRETFFKYIKKYHCVFDIEFINIYSKYSYDYYIPFSKCYIKEYYAVSNGRVIAAKKIALSLTEIDFNIIYNTYYFEDFKIANFYIYSSGYLPKEFIKCILQLYKQKTELKNIKGKEKEYLHAKECLNSTYGMIITNPLRDVFEYENIKGWNLHELTDVEKAAELIKYNTKKNRFLYYIWGIYVTAYARRNLWTAIHYLKDDYIYSDTDSVKFFNHEKHKKFFEIYNDLVVKKLEKTIIFYNLDENLIRPTNQNGQQKIIGLWEFEQEYKRFKNIGAKRYIYECEQAATINNKPINYNLTVSGINKDFALPFLIGRYKNKILENFDTKLYIPPNNSGKMLHAYINYETGGTVCDYLGNETDFKEYTSLHVEPCGYDFNTDKNKMLNAINIQKHSDLILNNINKFL